MNFLDAGIDRNLFNPRLAELFLTSTGSLHFSNLHLIATQSNGLARSSGFFRFIS